MFTGIIESTAKVLKITDSGLLVERPKIFDDIKIGCSIAVSGVCLSVTSFDASSMSFDVVATTLQKTKLGQLKPGDNVNLERAVRADGRFEGHIVTGHCEGVGEVVSLVRAPTPTPGPSLSVRIPSSLLPFIVPHGSITIDGVALTIADITNDCITVALIPHTLTLTTLGALQEGQNVNIETDILGKYMLSKHAHR